MNPQVFSPLGCQVGMTGRRMNLWVQFISLFFILDLFKHVQPAWHFSFEEPPNPLSVFFLLWWPPLLVGWHLLWSPFETFLNPLLHLYFFSDMGCKSSHWKENSTLAWKQISHHGWLARPRFSEPIRPPFLFLLHKTRTSILGWKSSSPSSTPFPSLLRVLDCCLFSHVSHYIATKGSSDGSNHEQTSTSWLDGNSHYQCYCCQYC